MPVSIKNLDSANAYGCDNVSLKMIKTCNRSLNVILRIIFEQSLKKVRFPEIWKKAKKKIKTFVCSPISLLSIFNKNFERVIYNSLFDHFLSNFHNRQQSVVLNGQISDCRKINFDVQQGLALRPLLILMFIDDLADGKT